jgi:hypothetical protein
VNYLGGERAIMYRDLNPALTVECVFMEEECNHTSLHSIIFSLKLTSPILEHFSGLNVEFYNIPF